MSTHNICFYGQIRKKKISTIFGWKKSALSGAICMSIWPKDQKTCHRQTVTVQISLAVWSGLSYLLIQSTVSNVCVKHTKWPWKRHKQIWAFSVGLSNEDPFLMTQVIPLDKAPFLFSNRKYWYFFLFLKKKWKKKVLWYSLEVSHWVASYEYQQCTF